MALVLLRTTRHPERVITADPDAWYRGDPKVMGQENYDEWRTAMRDSAVVRGMLEDYRAGLTVDYRDERADRAAGRKLRQPLLVLWSTRDDLEDLYGDPRVIWRDWTDDVAGHGIDAATTWQNWPPTPSPRHLATSSDQSETVSSRRPILNMGSSYG